MTKRKAAKTPKKMPLGAFLAAILALGPITVVIGVSPDNPSTPFDTPAARR